MDIDSNGSRIEMMTKLLLEASAAHSVYEKRVLNGVRDEEWPAWYAGYLSAHGIGDLLAVDSGDLVPHERLAMLLAEADRLHRSTAPQDQWPDFYARYLLALELVEAAKPGEAAPG